MIVLRVALDLPLSRLFDYREPEGLQVLVGQRVKVPFGRSERIGVVLERVGESDWPEAQLKEICTVLADLPPLPADFLRLCQFVARYYHAALGEVIHQALPAGLKKINPIKRRLFGGAVKRIEAGTRPLLTAAQQAVLASIDLLSGFKVHLLHGVTGSGKTEIYLRLIETALAFGRQSLLLVPEINLTPQLEERVRQRFPEVEVVALHSDLGDAARERHWRAAFEGRARIVLGTRLAVFTPMPELGILILDEEHDPSFKQQDGMRYSARDVAVARAHDLGLPVLLASATPSLESWANALHGRYQLLHLTERAVASARLPTVNILNCKKIPLQEGVSAHLHEEIRKRLALGEQSLIFLNRRGYAPVLGCTACGWMSRCTRCAANMVVHLADRRLRCHHCGLEQGVPRACPTCGNQDIHPFGRGTQRLEDWLQQQFPEARVVRVDRDSVKTRAQWEKVLHQIHAGEADILVGTQMLAKGHDFPKLTLVGVLGADSALFAADWRGPERLFAQLMQVAGRAGRADLPGEVLIQTEYPEHPLFAALRVHDYPGFAKSLLQEREEAGFPPYSFQAMLRAESQEMEASLAFLQAAATFPWIADAHPEITVFDPVPMRLSRLANWERGQLLIESASRPALHHFLNQWCEALSGMKTPGRLRWHLEVDPVEF